MTNLDAHRTDYRVQIFLEFLAYIFLRLVSAIVLTQPLFRNRVERVIGTNKLAELLFVTRVYA